MNVTIYRINGCPYCELALHFLRSEAIPHEVRTADPLTDNGVMLLTAKMVEDKGENKVVEVHTKANYPVLWSPLTKHMIQGWNQERYEQLADAYNRERRRRALDFAATQGGHPQPSAPVAESKPNGKEAAGVPAVSGVVGSNGNDPALAGASAGS